MSCKPCVVDPGVAHFFGDGLYAKEAIVPAGYSVGKHTHNYSHLSILGYGKAKVTAGDVVTEYVGPTCIEIKADVPHHIEAITDIVWFCIHATNEKDISKIDEILITKGG